MGRGGAGTLGCVGACANRRWRGAPWRSPVRGGSGAWRRGGNLPWRRGVGEGLALPEPLPPKAEGPLETSGQILTAEVGDIRLQLPVPVPPVAGVAVAAWNGPDIRVLQRPDPQSLAQQRRIPPALPHTSQSSNMQASGRAQECQAQAPKIHAPAVPRSFASVFDASVFDFVARSAPMPPITRAASRLSSRPLAHPDPAPASQPPCPPAAPTR